MRKRMGTVLALVALGGFALAGCGSSSPSTGSPGGTTPTNAPAATSAGGGGYGY